MRRRVRDLCLAVLVTLVAGCGVPKPDEPPPVERAEERVLEIVQQLFGAYKTESLATNVPKPAATYTNMEVRLREAATLMPRRADLKLGIASALVAQALQTNAPFELRMRSALEIYRELQTTDTNSFYAPILYAAYSRALRETNAAEAMLNRIVPAHRERTQSYIERFQRAEEILQLLPSEKAERNEALEGSHAIVILGAALETNGLIKPKLNDRLEQGLSLGQIYTNAPIVVTGGNPKTGVTEAYLMALWLIDRGIATPRIQIEDLARDTVGNAFRTLEIVQKLGATNVTLVTSASHVRRALVDFEEAARQRRLNLRFFHLAAKDEPAVDEQRERVSVYRDLMRASGVWAFPGFQQ